MSSTFTSASVTAYATNGEAVELQTTEEVQNVTTDMQTTEEAQEVTTDTQTSDEVQEVAIDTQTTEEAQEVSTDTQITEDAQDVTGDIQETEIVQEAKESSNDQEQAVVSDNDIEQDMELYTEGEQYTVNFTYDKKYVDFQAYIDDKKVTLQDGNVNVPVTSGFSYKIKLKNNTYMFTSITHSYSIGDDAYVENIDLSFCEGDDSGYYIVRPNFPFEDTEYKVDIEIKKAYTLSFVQSEHLGIYPVHLEEIGFVDDAGDISEAIKCPEGSMFYFGVEQRCAYGSLSISLDEAGEKILSPIGESVGAQAVYGVEITKDTTLYVKVLPRKIPIQYNAGLINDIQILNQEYVSAVTVSTDKKAIEIYEPANFTLRIKPAPGRILYEAHSVRVDVIEEETFTSIDNSYIMNEVYMDEEGYYLYDCTIGAENSLEYTEMYELEEGYTLSFYAPDAVITDIEHQSLEDSITVMDGGVFHFLVTPAARHQLLYVTTNGKEDGKIEKVLLEEQELECYSVKVTEDMTVSVVTQELDRQIFFETEGGVELCLPSDGGICSDNEGNYYVGTTTEKITFGMYPALSGTMPIVSMQTDRGKVVALSGKEGVSEGGEKIYLYTIDKKDFSGEMTVYAADPSVNRELRIEYLDNNFIDDDAIKVMVNGEETPLARIAGVEDGRVQAVYEIPVGKQADIEVGTHEYCYIDLANIREGNGVNTQTKAVSSRKYTDTIKMNLHTNISLATRGAINHRVYEIMGDGSHREVEPIGSTCQIMKGKTYWIKSAYGNTPVNLSEVTTSSLRDYTYQMEDILYIDPDDTSAFFFTVPEEATISFGTVRLDVRGTYLKNDAILNMRKSLQLQLVEDVGSIEVRMPNVQYIDSYSVIRITLEAETRNQKVGWANVGLEITAEEGMEEHITYDWKPNSLGGVLRICADSYMEPGEAAQIRFYRYDKEKGDEDYYIPLHDNRDNELPYISYTPQVATALTENAPVAKVVSTDDVSMTLDLLADYKRAPLNGKQYYKVEITPKGENVPESIQAATEEPFYVVRQYPETDEEGNELPGFTQKERFVVNTAAPGYGQEWKYDVAVTLVQTYDKTPITTENEEEQVAYKSLKQSFTDVSTKTPAFAVKLSLKKGASQIYTTQTDVKVADLKYDQYTVCMDATVEDITECSENEKLAVRVENNQIIASATADTAMGKHTIQITPFALSSMYSQPVTTTVTVVKGIEELDIDVPATEVYKAAGKAASMKSTVVYNDGDKTTKTKKVTWSIVDSNGIELDEEDALYGMVTVKNGNVSVDKKLQITEDGDYSFRVKAQAADFTGNTTSAMSDVLTVTEEPIAIGHVIIVKENEYGNYDLVAKSAKTAPALTTDMLVGTELIALREGYEIQESYMAGELEQVSIPATQLTIKSSSAKSVSLTKDGERIVIGTDKPAKNVKLTVTANDGGKKSGFITITTQYAVPEELGLRVRSGAVTLNDVTQNETTAYFKGTVNTKLTLTVMQKSEDIWKELQAYTNHSVSISGGKIIASDIEKGEYTILINKDKATVTLSDKANKKNVKYNIYNTAYSAKGAPGISLKKKTPTSIVCGVLANRCLEYDINAKYSAKDKYIRVEMDELSAMKKRSDYAAFADACDMVDKTVALDGNSFKLNFSDDNIPLGNYKLTITLGTKAGGNFIADVKPVNVTVKVVKPKTVKGSYRAATTYNNVVIATDGKPTEISLTGTTRNVHSVTYTNVANANIKGRENAFLTYFELTNDNKLRLKDGLTAEQIATLKTTKTDNYGYVTYTVIHGDNGYGVPYTETKTIKVTVKLKK